jgi:hypothetical protein
MLHCIRCQSMDVVCIIAVHTVVYAVFIFNVMCVTVACLDTTPYWVGCTAVLIIATLRQHSNVAFKMLIYMYETLYSLFKTFPYK